MTEKEICSGCRRHCDLNTPYCGKGKEFAENGILSEHRHSKKQHHGAYIPHDHSTEMNDKLILDLRDISHMMRMQYEGKASQKRILIILHASGMLTQKELTDRLGIQPGSVSEILSKLENAGLITRTQNKTDRRTMDILLTAAGTELALEATAQRQKRHEEMFSCLTSEEKMTLLSLLEKIHTDWECRFAKSPDHHSHHGKHRCRGNRHHGGNSHHGA